MVTLTPREQLDDHQRRPRNLGKLLNASATGDVGSIVVGDALRFYVKIADGRISEARFQVFNAGDQVASASVVTELAVGRTPDEAMALGPVDVCAHLGGLAAEDLPPIIWGLEGLRSAIAVHRSEIPEADEELQPLFCRCHGIPEETVRQSMQIMALDSVQGVVDATGVGTGCGSCRADIPRLLAEAVDKPLVKEAAKQPSGAVGRIPTVMKIQRFVSEKIQPDATKLGGTIELWDFDGTIVTVSVRGLADDQKRKILADLEGMMKAEVDARAGVREK
ncbi:MAG: iron-sulfur cluster assembly scaffold protein [Planctomycetota bacterium]